MSAFLPNAGPADTCRFTAGELRLRRHAEFQRVYGATKKQHSKQMSFFAAARPVTEGEYPGPRVGLTVGRVMGKAHERNRIKRRLREAIRAEQAALGGRAVDVVLHPRKTVETLPFVQLCAEVRQVFAQVRKRTPAAAARAVHTVAAEGIERSVGAVRAVVAPGSDHASAEVASGAVAEPGFAKTEELLAKPLDGTRV